MIFKDLFVGTKRRGRLIFGREYAVGNQISTNRLNKSAQQISNSLLTQGIFSSRNRVKSLW